MATDSDTCVCGHVRDEHALGKMFSKCEVEGCRCLDFEAEETFDDDEQESES